MSPPPSSTRSTHVDASGATRPSIATSTSALAAAASRNANPAVSAALQGATLAFNKQKAAAAVGGNGNSNSNSNGSSAGSLGLGPAPSRQPNQNNVHAITAGQGTGPNNRSGTGVSAASAQRPEPRGGSGALLAATRAARDHAAAAAATTAVTRPRPVDERSPGYAGGGVARHATGGTTVNTSLSGDGESKEAAGSAHWSGTELDGGGHAHGGLVAQRLLELHAAGGGTGSHRSTLLPPPGGPDCLTGNQASSPSSTSPSFIAATLAASRSASPTRGPIPQLDLNGGRPTRARRQSTSNASVSAGSLSSSVMPERDLPDTSSIPPTTSLVSLFESKRGKDDVDPVKKKAPSVRTESGDVRSQAGGEEAQQAPGKAKPKPVPKPKPGFSPDHGRKTGLDGNARGSASDTSQRGNTTALDGSDDNKGRSDLRPPRSPPASQSAGHKPITKPSASASQRPTTPPSSAPDRAISNRTNPQTMKLLGTPRMEPPTPPERASGTTMKGPAVPCTLSTSRNDRADAVPHDYQDLTPKPRQPSQSSTPSDDTFVSASSVQLRTMPPVNAADETAVQRPPVPRRSPSPRSTTTPEFQPPLSSDTSTTNLTLGSLTNAIVASNIASARLTPTSSSQPPPVPAPRRSGRSSPLRPHHTADSIRSQLGGGGSGSRSPSRRNAPQQQQQQPHKTGVLLQTLRSLHTSLSDDEDARRHQLHHHHRRRNKVLGGGNRKHAHHEGSRRRWRDEITPRERRRYEAVWASNRGLLLRPGWAVQYTAADGDEPEGEGKREAEADSQDDDNNNNNNNSSSNNILDQSRAPPGRPEAELVVNVVARDIWSRSRLPADELAEVWDLVDRGRRGALGRDEFVVGMWLIDQRLRGRKIPARVSRSVWDSVAGGAALGVVVPLPPKVPAGSKKTGQGWKGW